MGENPRRLQVVVTTGPKDPTRARFALEAALAAVASGLGVTVFLTLDATVWACESRRYVCGETVYGLMDQLASMGASVVCCSACALDKCGTQGEAKIATAPGIELVGLATLMEQVASGVPTVTF
ncbi:MAG: DsrE family protein [Planctomycetota bacterium]